MATCVQRREIGRVDPENAKGPDQDQRHQLEHRRNDLNEARFLNTPDVDQRDKPDRTQRHGKTVGLRPADSGEQEPHIASERHCYGCVACPKRDPVTPGDDEAGKLPIAGLGIGIGTASLRYEPRQPPENDGEHERPGRSNDPTRKRDRPEGCERGRQKKYSRANHVADHQRGAGGKTQAGRRGSLVSDLHGILPGQGLSHRSWYPPRPAPGRPQAERSSRSNSARPGSRRRQ